MNRGGGAGGGGGAAAEEPVLLSELDQARLDLISAARTSVEDVREWQHNHEGISDYSVNMAVDSSTEWRALHVLCSQRDAVSVRNLLCAPGIDVNKIATGGVSPAHVCAQFGAAACLKLLLDPPPAGDDLAAVKPKPANIGAITRPERYTPLHYAAMAGYRACVEELLNAGASPSLPDAKDDTPLDLAREKKYGAVAEAIENKLTGGDGSGGMAAVETWLKAIGLPMYYEGMLTQGFNDLGFIVKHGLTHDCCDRIGVDPGKGGHRRKLITAYRAAEFLPKAEGAGSGTSSEDDSPGTSSESSSDEEEE